jgi:hypothetical protein
MARLLELPGDTTALHDPRNSRYLIINPDAIRNVRAAEWRVVGPALAQGSGCQGVRRVRSGIDHRRGRVALPPKTRLVGFGNGTLYLVRRDDDDLEYLQRYRLQ